MLSSGRGATYDHGGGSRRRARPLFRWRRAVRGAALASLGALAALVALAGGRVGAGPPSPAVAAEDGVVVVSFEATADRDLRVALSWETASEAGLLGFHVYRSDRPDDGFERVDTALVPAVGGPTQGALYTFDDRPGEGEFYYRLEIVDTAGATEWVAQVTVTVRAERFVVFLPFLRRR